MRNKHREFGEVLRSLRCRAGYGQYGGIGSFIAALEVSLGKRVAYATVHSYESGQCVPSYAVVSAWLSVTCRTPREIVDAYVELHMALAHDRMAAGASA